MTTYIHSNRARKAEHWRRGRSPQNGRGRCAATDERRFTRAVQTEFASAARSSDASIRRGLRLEASRKERELDTLREASTKPLTLLIRLHIQDESRNQAAFLFGHDTHDSRQSAFRTPRNF